MRSLSTEYNAPAVRRERLDARLKTVEAIDLPDGLHIGKVVTGSGYRKSGESALDWALVEVATHRVGKNEASPVRAFMTTNTTLQTNTLQSKTRSQIASAYKGRMSA